MHSVQSKPDLLETSIIHRRVSMALIMDILRVSREFFYFINLLKKQNATDRNSLSDSLSEAGEIVKDMFDNLSSGNFPDGSCQRLETLGKRIYYQLEVVLGADHAQALVDKFKQTHRLELLRQEFIAGSIDPRELVLLDEAARHFSATSKMLRV
jgi:hypothetical protein